jgi:hypothetical protein
MVLLSCLLAGCSTITRLDLREVRGFGHSQCAVLRADGNLYIDRRQPLLGGAGSTAVTPHRASFYRPGEQRLGTPSRIIDAGTKLQITSIQAWWDFENGHRIRILGRIDVDGNNDSFLFDRFFLNEPDPNVFARELFAPCA